MDIRNIASKLVTYIAISELPEKHHEYGKDHLYEMADKIITRTVTGYKAHRWLGWIQACICFGNGGTLEEMKRLNKEVKE